MLEITGNEIMQLNDADLRTLIGYLCEAELRSLGVPTAGVTMGGNQDAKDGGIDVRVDVNASLIEDGFVPRAKTGFQVKKPDMPRAEILKEMRYKGKLRTVLIDLALCKGAYIIVSIQGSTSDTALNNRKAAMCEALVDCPNAEDLKVDFYDRERVAGWVRSCPSLIPWVRAKIGHPMQGWKSFREWARFRDNVEEEYLLDSQVRLSRTNSCASDGQAIIDGINELRRTLQRTGSSVRLVGLSGVGKTRLLQALFDERIGLLPLNRSQVYYADISDNPEPSPLAVATELISQRQPAVLVIDNCPPDLHRKLTAVCSTTGSHTSLITVEYDVREDQPEETEVFHLEPSSAELLEKLIRSRFDYISEVDSGTIARFSGGNARIAMAIANTIKRGESLGTLRDRVLFERLFRQRNSMDQNLQQAAEACALVYSFDGETIDQEDSELALLGSLVGMSAKELYSKVSELKRRDLVQARGKWRAVLPHAIANWLAQKALENTPLDNILAVFARKGRERLLRSFSRRMGYLHESFEAKKIADIWLSEEGLIGDVSNLNQLGMDLLTNIAPIDPQTTLAAIERVARQEIGEKFLSRENPHFIIFTRLLLSLAYDANLFDRAVGLLCRLALTENPDENNNSIRSELKSLFFIKLSGTNATPEQRLAFVQNLIDSRDKKKIELGVLLLDATFETWHFSSSHHFDFGARKRDYGYSPRNNEDVKYWFKKFIDYAAIIATSNCDGAMQLKSLLAEKFRGLWIKAGMYNELEQVAHTFSSKGQWIEGWVAIKKMVRFDGKIMDADLLSRLEKLDNILAPKTLIERAKIYAVVPQRFDLFDALGNKEEFDTDEYTRIGIKIRSIGQEVGGDDKAFQQLLPDILSNDGTGLYQFGQGLADGCDDCETIWQQFLQQLSLLEKSSRRYQVMRGFLNIVATKNVGIAGKILDEAISNDLLSEIYPLLQIDANIDAQGIKRIKKSLELDRSPVKQYVYLAYGRSHESLTDKELCEIIKIISTKAGGIEVALEILEMRIYGRAKEIPLSLDICACGQEVMMQLCFSDHKGMRDKVDRELALIIKACFVGDAAKVNAKLICESLFNGIDKHEYYWMDYKDAIGAFASVQPEVFLDSFLGRNNEAETRLHKMFYDDFELYINPISLIDDDVVIKWCEIDPTVRYPRIATAIKPYQKIKHEKLLNWTSLALKLISSSPDPILVLTSFKTAFRPTGWSGLRSDIMQERLNLVAQLKNHDDEFVADWASKEEEELADEIKTEREWESKRSNATIESFE